MMIHAKSPERFSARFSLDHHLIALKQEPILVGFAFHLVSNVRFVEKKQRNMQWEWYIRWQSRLNAIRFKRFPGQNVRGLSLGSGHPMTFRYAARLTD